MINERLKILLSELNLSQRQFAQKINLDAGYFSRIIQGKVIPPDRILLLIESVFRVRHQWLISGEGDIFQDQDASPLKKRILEMVEQLSDEQVRAVSAFIRYLTEEE